MKLPAIGCSLFALVFLMTPACGDEDPSEVAGSYTVSVTNGDNGCNFENFTTGESASNISVVITQEGSDASATVEGIAGALLDLLLDDNTFTGDVEGDDVALEIIGSRALQEGNCAFTYNATLNAKLTGDALQGTIKYRPATNNNDDCAEITGCVTVQNFSGTRPPQ